MNTVIRMKAGACAILFASLMATTGPAVAMLTIECKNELSTSAGPYPSEAEAAAAAENLWKQEVMTKYGALSWTYFSNATGIQYNCGYSASEGGWICHFTATPCSPVTPPSSSAAIPEPPHSRATRLPEPSDSDTRTTSPGRRTGGAGQPGAAMRMPSAATGPGRDRPVASPGSAGQRQ